MVDVHTSINHSDDSGTANSKTVLCVMKPDDLHCWLNHIAVPSDGAVIIHRSGIVESGGNAVERRLGDGEESIRLNTDDSQQGLDKVQRSVQEIDKKVVGGRYEEGLADLTVQRALNLAFEEIAKIEDGGQAARGTDDVAILCRRRLCSAKRKNEHGDNEDDSFHSFNPVKGSPTDEFLSVLPR